VQCVWLLRGEIRRCLLAHSFLSLVLDQLLLVWDGVKADDLSAIAESRRQALAIAGRGSTFPLAREGSIHRSALRTLSVPLPLDSAAAAGALPRQPSPSERPPPRQQQDPFRVNVPPSAFQLDERRTGGGESTSCLMSSLLSEHRLSCWRTLVPVSAVGGFPGGRPGHVMGHFSAAAHISAETLARGLTPAMFLLACRCAGQAAAAAAAVCGSAGAGGRPNLAAAATAAADGLASRPARAAAVPCRGRPCHAGISGTHNAGAPLSLRCFLRDLKTAGCSQPSCKLCCSF
jgi:hypothetical protein